MVRVPFSVFCCGEVSFSFQFIDNNIVMLWSRAYGMILMLVRLLVFCSFSNIDPFPHLYWFSKYTGTTKWHRGFPQLLCLSFSLENGSFQNGILIFRGNLSNSWLMMTDGGFVLRFRLLVLFLRAVYEEIIPPPASQKGLKSWSSMTKTPPRIKENGAASARKSFLRFQSNIQSRHQRWKAKGPCSSMLCIIIAFWYE